MEVLLNELSSFEKYRFSYKGCLNNYKNKNRLLHAVIHRKINKLLVLFDELLISRSGGCDWENIELMNENGYYVSAGERDRFGWLSGIVTINKGYIVYG